MRKETVRYILLILIGAAAVIVTGLGMYYFLSDSPAGNGGAPQPGSSAETAADGDTSQKPSDSEPPDPTGFTVYIETGHGIEDNGNWDPGASWSDGSENYEEAKMMIPIARAMASFLRQSGVEVYTDADDDNNQNLAYTLDFLDAHREVDAFVNLHCDWEEAESGTMPLYRTEEQRVLAEALNESVHEYIDIPDRGLTYREDLDTLSSGKVHCPAVLFETGAIRADNHILTTQYDDYGKGLAAGMCRYLGIPAGF
ncbi:MAG: N-acetylmuramoyl-L-alanine amidase [Firmicutes bacterium]|nr:N-acetylmuramoyl-L-alanine amidase [Bacillota bacterium]